MPVLSLPSQPIPFIGRENELAKIASLLLTPDCRLLTLTGTGGVGKTRLAIEAAHRTSFPNGVFFTPLQRLSSADFIVSAIANAVSFQFYPDADPKLQLIHYLRDKALLLVLDNLEHLLDGISILAEILSNAPSIRILATSRERLNLREEWVFEVGGLDYPANESETDIARYSAIALFLQRARHTDVNFRLGNENISSVIRICCLVGGMPLGIELAATWVRALSCEQIANEIERNLDILETPVRNVEPRHRNMRGAFEPTWQHLSKEEREVFSNLTVFRGGITREAAEFVAGASLRTLTALVDKSLLKLDAGNRRYDLHELLRQFAAEKLTVNELKASAQRHLTYYLKIAEQAEANQFGSEQILWSDRLDSEMDNLNTALGWALANSEAETGLRLAVALGWFFSERAHWSEGAIWLERMVVANPNAPSSLLSKAYCKAGALISLQQDRKRGPELCKQALLLARATNDRWNIAWALSDLANFSISTFNERIALLEESLGLFRELDDSMGITHTLIRRAWLAFDMNEYPYVRELSEEALGRASETGDPICIAWSTFSLGLVSWHQDHDPEQTKAYFETSLAQFRVVHVPFLYPILFMGETAQAMGDNVFAQTLYEEVLGVLWDNKFNPDVRFILHGSARLARNNALLERAAKLLGATVKAAVVENKSTSDLDNFSRDIAEIREQLGETAFAEAWTEGNAMTREQAISYALKGRVALFELAATRQDDESKTEKPNNLLSNRALEILNLMANGLNSREIAARLILSVDTVRWYLKQIYAKLDAHSRSEAIARARELKILH